MLSVYPLLLKAKSTIEKKIKTKKKFRPKLESWQDDVQYAVIESVWSQASMNWSNHKNVYEIAAYAWRQICNLAS